MINPNQRQLVLVWDFPVRVFHGLLAVSFAGAWLTAEGKELQMIHYAFGYSACALVLLRIFWGIVGTRYARFSQFIKGPSETMHHIKSILSGNMISELGHNPVGALVMISLMILILLIGLTGYWTIKGYLGEYMSGAHEAISEIALGFVVIHIAGAIIMSYLQKENLVKSMITGKKAGLPDQAIQSSQYIAGLILILTWVYCVYMVFSGAWTSLTR
jgi:cytochrome b